MCRIGNPEWLELSVYHDDYISDEEEELALHDDDTMWEEYDD